MKARRFSAKASNFAQLRESTTASREAKEGDAGAVAVKQWGADA